MATIIMMLSVKVNGETIPTAVAREFGPYGPQLLEEADITLDVLAEDNPQLNWRHGKIVMLCFDKSGPKPPERMTLPNGGEVVFLDMYSPQKSAFPAVMKDYARCVDVGRDALCSGHTPEYAATAAWKYAKKRTSLEVITESQHGFTRLVDAMKELSEALDTEAKEEGNT